VRSTLRAGCWKTIGINGDGSCVQLLEYVHCRNCPVYAGAAAQLLDIETPPRYAHESTQAVAAEKPVAPAQTTAVVIFRIGAEWLALPSSIFREVAADRLIHSLPHRRSGALLGVVNIRGELLVCASLAHILGVDSGTAAGGMRRMLVLQEGSNRIVCPVDEVHGIERFQVQSLCRVPAILGASALTFTRGVLSWRRRSVGVLDSNLVHQALNRSFQSATLT
jgi:chemotaxis-related protein WspD